MMKFYIILSLLVVGAFTQDMPPPELEPPSTTTTPAPSTEPPTTTPEPITEAPTPEPEPETTTTTTTTTPEPSTEPPTPEPKPQPTTTTTPEPSTETPTPETTTLAPTTTTKQTTTKSPDNDLPQRPVTDSPYIPSSTTSRYPYYPGYPDFGNRRCYYKKQYGHARWQFTCNGWQYVYPVECYHCCLYQYATFAACYRVHAHNCKSSNRPYYY